ncbi:hypothetical protein [Xylanibacter muris]|uniref:Bacterial alpha-L-rhamnosidase N-terminal domain-containing protein n=1 Tax=Xylanibacter muris TaxID=2736290 RepID=A0ABX2ANI1_9BACT|nr:hypothetical protein [Xylanibacter muris]NPD92559.1 hypothetical protein [Xylanibacter muris]
MNIVYAVILFLLILPVPAVYGSGNTLWWQGGWISHPSARDGEQILFSRMYTGLEEVSRATVSVAANGRYQLFVNGYNVTTAVMEYGDDVVSQACGGPNAVGVVVYEVGRFLDADTNVVALWCSPDNTGRCFASVVFCGYDGFRPLFSYSSDSLWMCGISGAATSFAGDYDMSGTVYESERHDSRLYNPGWSGYEYETWRWMGAETSDIASVRECVPAFRYVPRPVMGTCRAVEHIHDGVFSREGRNSFLFSFDEYFSGWVRVTLRNMHRGDTVSVNGLGYICSGETDEQLCRRFTESGQRVAFVEGERLTKANITNVEGICVGSRNASAWGY